jgi:predicted TIM-barrel fold metal-dependent hydrolase
MIVDLHTHLWESLDQLGADAAASIRQMAEMPWDRPVTNVDSHREAMEPVTYAVILGFESQYLGASIPIEQVSRYVQLDPGKYVGFGGVDPMKPGYLAQVDLAVARGLSGIVICPAAQAYHPEHTRAMQLYEKCEALGLPIMVHGPTHFGPAAQMRFAQPFLFDEVAQTFPKLRMVISQLGYPWVEQTMMLIGKHEHVYADLSHVASRPLQLYNTLLSAHQLKVMPKVLLGSDFPFSKPQDVITTLYSLSTLVLGTQLPSVPRDQIRAIVERDSLACLGIEHPKGPEADDAPQKNPEQDPEQDQDTNSDDEKSPSGQAASDAGFSEQGSAIKVSTPPPDQTPDQTPDQAAESQTDASDEADGTEKTEPADQATPAQAETEVTTSSDPDGQGTEDQTQANTSDGNNGGQSTIENSEAENAGSQDSGETAKDDEESTGPDNTGSSGGGVSPLSN